MFVVFICGLFVSASGFSVFAQSAEELKNQISNTSAEIEKIEQQIKEYRAMLQKVGAEKDTLSRAIKELDLNAKKLGADLKVTEKKMKNANLELETIGDKIYYTNDTIQDTEEVISGLVRDINEISSESLLESLVRDGMTLGDTWRYVDQTMSTREALQKHIDLLQNTKVVLEEDKKEVEKIKEELGGLTNNLKNQKKVVDLNTKEKNTLLKQTKSTEASYAALVKEREARKAQFETDLKDFESKLSYILDPSSIPASGLHVFVWPVDNVRITQFFGKTVAAKKLYASGSHSGVDFGMPVGTPVKAMLSGTVVGQGNTDLVCKGASYGNWILIEHGNGLTSVYGHLSLVSKKAGDKVSTGEVVAYSGSTGYSTGPHLHVSVFPDDAVNIMQVPSRACGGGKTYTIPVAARTAYLDPMDYLPTYIKK